MTPQLPSFKPIVKVEMKGIVDKHPPKFPFIKNNKVYLYASTNEKDFIADELKYKAWTTNKILGPDKWWLAWIPLGWNPNLSKVQELCNKKAPDSVVALYHPVWQFRFALGKVDKLLLENARFDWEFFWSKEFGASSVRMN
jgi:hypothetical protein